MKKRTLCTLVKMLKMLNHPLINRRQFDDWFHGVNLRRFVSDHDFRLSTTNLDSSVIHSNSVGQ